MPGGATLGRKQVDNYGNPIRVYDAKGLAYVKVTERAKGLGDITNPVAKLLDTEIVETILARIGTQDDDMIFFSADNKGVVVNTMGALRLRPGKDLDITNETK